MKKALAFDIGGTKIYSAIVDETGKILYEPEKFSTPKTLDEIKNLLRNQIVKFENEVDIIAIATAGAINNENTRVIGSTGNLVEGYYTIDFQALSNKKVFLENDANSAAWAEYKIGASKGSTVSVMLTLGTGVGGGIIINDRILKANLVLQVKCILKCVLINIENARAEVGIVSKHMLRAQLLNGLQKKCLAILV